jgi:hypothetical protein
LEEVPDLKVVPDLEEVPGRGGTGTVDGDVDDGPTPWPDAGRKRTVSDRMATPTRRNTRPRG